MPGRKFGNWDLARLPPRRPPRAAAPDDAVGANVKIVAQLVAVVQMIRIDD
jgi:hypothetical protein